MSNLALRVDGLGKLYRIGGKQERYATLRDTLTDAMAAPFKRARSLLRGEAYGAAGLKEEIWALKDVSFEVQHGEVVGIIGRNGAGKSTLLKILSRITEPTEGYAEVYGRVGSLLEVGTGFHPELTGRENIYLNGAILGMSRAEIDRKFDEIVDFAEIERFIDTPVKHYSSGMGLRLGFAVAAHLEPEILVVDEVLAVGDAQFQKKCLGKMSEVAGEGRTVLFVSHNMAAVRQLCQQGIVLDQGGVFSKGQVDKAIDDYLRPSEQTRVIDLRDRTDRLGSGDMRFVGLAICNSQGREVDTVAMNESVQFLVHYEAREERKLRNVMISIRIDEWLGQPLFTLSNEFTQGSFSELDARGTLICYVPSLPLLAGNYRVFLWCAVGGIEADRIENALQFSVYETDIYGTGKIPIQRKHGNFFVDHGWDAWKVS